MKLGPDYFVGCRLSWAQYDKIRRLLGWFRTADGWAPRRIPGEPNFQFPSPCCRKLLYQQALKLSRKYGIEHVELEDFHGARVDVAKTAEHITAFIRLAPTEPLHLQICGDGFRAIRHCEVLNACIRVLKRAPLLQSGFSALFTL